MMKRSTLGGGTLVALALLFAGITMVAGYALRSWRIDLTQNRLYTTAPGTDHILKGLQRADQSVFLLQRGNRQPVSAGRQLRQPGA